uniref:Uncharacterized protein n=1 Tax=Arundo donax TaxID=35708 RepID=A0A0A9HC87_ARUDO
MLAPRHISCRCHTGPRFSSTE